MVREGIQNRCQGCLEAILHCSFAGCGLCHDVTDASEFCVEVEGYEIVFA